MVECAIELGRSGKSVLLRTWRCRTAGSTSCVCCSSDERASRQNNFATRRYGSDAVPRDGGLSLLPGDQQRSGTNPALVGRPSFGLAASPLLVLARPASSLCCCCCCCCCWYRMSTVEWPVCRRKRPCIGGARPLPRLPGATSTARATSWISRHETARTPSSILTIPPNEGRRESKSDFGACRCTAERPCTAGPNEQ